MVDDFSLMIRVAVREWDVASASVNTSPCRVLWMLWVFASP